MRTMQTIFAPNGNLGQKIAFLAASALSANALSDQCYAVEVFATQDVYISTDLAVDKTGTVVSAVTSGLSYWLPKNILHTLSVPSKAVFKIQGDSADGVLHINELTS